MDNQTAIEAKIDFWYEMYPRYKGIDFMSIYESFQQRYDNMNPYDSVEEECFEGIGDYCNCKQCRRNFYLEEQCLDEEFYG